MSSPINPPLLWVEYLCIPILNGGNAHTLLDFNRFRYKGVPQTHLIKSGKVQTANRDDIAQSLFFAITNRQDASPATKGNIFLAARKHFIFCDNQCPPLIPLSNPAFIKELERNSIRQRRGEIKDSTETKMRGDLVTLYSWMELSTKGLIPNRLRSRNTQTEPTRGYSDNDLNKLLPLLRGIFKQLCKQFITNPKLHMQAGSNTETMVFSWKGKDYPVCGGASKIFYAATFLLSYYTWSNSTVLYNLKRPSISSHTLSKNWHQMPAFKRRAFKTITVEIGEHNRLEIPKYAMQFFDQLLTVSALVDPGPDGLLLPAYSYRKRRVQRMSACLLSDFKIRWLDKHFPMTDDRGNKLWPVPRRFRATGSHLTLANRGAVEAALLLDNTPDTIKRAYSSGNPHENNKMNHDTSLTLEQVARDRQGVETAKKKVCEAQKVEILTYETYIRRASPPSRSANGSYCQKTNGDKAERFTYRAHKHDLVTDNEKLACADLLNCWICSHQVLVESTIDIWCALSFRECLEESIYLHLDSKHYKNNFEQSMSNIDDRLKNISQRVLKKAREKLLDEGRHPLWLDASSFGMEKG
ncbi:MULTISPECIES: hypothetical protein [Vibrio]|uniref:Uncharacterized protein n=1 Tax=Vibrio kanaloae TaxID=170673 RepID=A0A4U1ZSZ6_9VIBR|nr:MULTISPECIES: hypothetical protein [Vibrio]EIA1617527.1 hypothetical protein [Vibrio parahaemolyticus]ODW44754.1 hypothetical protein BBL83_06035 [Vibrio parahaemolyticus]TKF36117.1 hypothetical protein FCV50_02610 [Vibrio kanaloae]TMX52210.1 hypothetical protein DA091_11895 [Vibrio alginolyticus]